VDQTNNTDSPKMSPQKINTGNYVFKKDQKELGVGKVAKIENGLIEIRFQKSGKKLYELIPELFQVVELGTRDGNVVFKMNYNDADYRGVCSEKIIRFNEKIKTSYCSQAKCRKWRGKTLTEDDYPCDESILFREWFLTPGSSFRTKAGKLKRDTGDPFSLKYAKKGKIAFPTTKKPNQDEKDRYLLGLLHINEIWDPPKTGPQKDSTYIYGDDKTSVEFHPMVRIFFWKYYKNSDNSIRWASNRFRYLTDRTTLEILKNVKREYQKLKPFTKKISRDLAIINDHIERYKKLANNMSRS